MKKTDFSLLTDAYCRDKEMSDQICRLLSEERIDEGQARMMFDLVRGGHLRTEHSICTLPHHYLPATTPWRPWPYPYFSWRSTTTLTSAAHDITSNAVALANGSD